MVFVRLILESSVLQGEINIQNFNEILIKSGDFCCAKYDSSDCSLSLEIGADFTNLLLPDKPYTSFAKIL